jgi:hypothetical protein
MAIIHVYGKSVLFCGAIFFSRGWDSGIIGAYWGSYPRLVDLILWHKFLTVSTFTFFVNVIPTKYILFFYYYYLFKLQMGFYSVAVVLQ